jgi:hypothetical protein
MLSKTSLPQVPPTINSTLLHSRSTDRLGSGTVEKPLKNLTRSVPNLIQGIARPQCCYTGKPLEARTQVTLDRP